jgi:hypothetical protein
MSNLDIIQASAAGHAVAAVRAELEETGQIAQFTQLELENTAQIAQFSKPGVLRVVTGRQHLFDASTGYCRLVTLRAFATRRGKESRDVAQPAKRGWGRVPNRRVTFTQRDRGEAGFPALVKLAFNLIYAE